MVSCSLHHPSAQFSPTRRRSLTRQPMLVHSSTYAHRFQIIPPAHFSSVSIFLKHNPTDRYADCSSRTGSPPILGRVSSGLREGWPVLLRLRDCRRARFRLARGRAREKSVSSKRLVVFIDFGCGKKSADCILPECGMVRPSWPLHLRLVPSPFPITTRRERRQGDDEHAPPTDRICRAC